MLIKRFLVVLVCLCFLVTSVFAQSYNVSSAWQGAGQTVYVVNSGGGDYEVWNYYQLLTVSNTSVVPVGFQLNFTVWYGVGTNSQGNFYLSGHGSPDFSDLRFVDGHGVLLNATYSSMTVNSFVHVWVKLEDSLTIVMYYGNPYVTSDWSDLDGSDVFDVVSSGLIGGYVFSSGGLIVDDSGLDNDMSVTGTSVVSSGFSGLNARGFDGSDDLANMLNLTGDLLYQNGTIVFGVSLGLGNLASDRFVSNGGGAGVRFYFGLGSTNNLWYRLGDLTDTYGDTVFSNGTWYNVGLVWFSDPKCQVYVNGVTDDSLQSGYVHSGKGSNYYLGAAGAGFNHVNASFSYLMVFNVSLGSGVMSGFDGGYPQLFSNHLGSVYLRQWLSPSVYGVVSAGEVSPNLVEDTSTANVTFVVSVVVSVVLSGLCLVLALKSRAWIVNGLVGLVAVGFAAWSYAGGSVVLGGWLLFLVVVCGVLCLAKAALSLRG